MRSESPQALLMVSLAPLLAFGSSCLEDFELGSSPLVVQQLRYKGVQSLLTKYHLYILHDLFWFLLFLFSQRNKPDGHPCGWVGILWGSPDGSGNRVCLQYGRPRIDPWVGKISWRRKWQPTLVFLPGKSHGQRSLTGYCPWGSKESDMTERLHSFSFQCSMKLYNVCLNLGSPETRG